MTNEAGAAKARCVHCREEISVADRYAHGDHIKCGVCNTKHKVVRGDRLRLVIADVGPLRDALAQNEQLVERLEAELAHARASLGIGGERLRDRPDLRAVPGGREGRARSARACCGRRSAIAVVAGLLLEAANWSFLAKRSAMTRLGHELDEARAESQKLRQQIREAGKSELSDDGRHRDGHDDRRRNGRHGSESVVSLWQRHEPCAKRRWRYWIWPFSSSIATVR